MTHTLSGKRVVVTGAAGGIAQATIKELRAQGASVAGIDLRPIDDIIPADVRDPASVTAAVTEAVGRLGGLDILVNCAGIGSVQDAGQMPDEETRRTIEINLMGPWVTVAAALPHLLESQGHVVVVTSVLAVATTPFSAAYSASKHALDAYANSLRMEYDGRLSVTTVRPGYIKTAIHDRPASRGVSLDGVTNVDTVEQAAQAIARACTRRPRTLTTSRATGFSIFMAQHFPGLVEGVIIRRGRKRVLELKPEAASGSPAGS
jgi:NAD(P)-dependent dehydrogenase (short-subunit alcohol dehydrogenase family)